jgi:transketolase
MRDAFIKVLGELAKNDPRIILVTGDLGFKVFDEYALNFPKQFLNAGVAEQNMMGLATGLALEGRVVFVYSIANFPILRCLEQIRNDACYHQSNVKIVSIGGGFSYGALGISHHATEDLSIMRALPEISVMAPGDLWETEETTKAMVDIPGTCYFRLDKSNAGYTNTESEKFEFGKARCLKEGRDATLISTGGILNEVLKAHELLSAKGIECRVLSLHTLKPLDLESIFKAAKETNAILTIEEHTIEGGLGGAVAENLLEYGVLPNKFHRIGLKTGFSSVVGSQNYLRKVYKMDAQSIAQSVSRLLKSDQPAIASNRISSK